MPANNEPPTANQTTQHPKAANRRYLKATLAGSAGGLVAVLIFLLEQRPELAQMLLERVLIAWGPQFIIVLILLAFLYLLADRYAPRLIRAQSETALALQDLARSVEQLASRDDSFRREQDVLLNHVARRVDALYQLLESHRRSLNGHLARLSRPAHARTRHRFAEPRGTRLGERSGGERRTAMASETPRRSSRKLAARGKPHKRRRRIPQSGLAVPTGPPLGTLPRIGREPATAVDTKSQALATPPTQSMKALFRSTD